MKSIFERILSGDLLGEIIYENDLVFALIDIKPISKGHVLIIPKIMKKNIFEETNENIVAIFDAAKLIKQAYIEVLNAKGFKFNTNVNKEADQVVFHTHYHLIPYYKNGPEKVFLTEIELNDIKKILKKQ